MKYIIIIAVLILVVTLGFMIKKRNNPVFLPGEFTGEKEKIYQFVVKDISGNDFVNRFTRDTYYYDGQVLW